MNKQIKIILDDLYKIDSSLRDYETQVVQIINELLVSRPDTKFDEKFARKLREELLSRARVLSQSRQIEEPINLFTNPLKFAKQISGTSFKDMLTIKKLSYAGIGVVVIILAIAIWQYVGPSGQLLPSGDKLAFAPKITKVGKQAFGSLLASQANMARTESGGGGGDQAASTPTALGLGGGGGVAGVAKESSAAGMIAPEPVSYRFVYIGEDFNLDESQITVLKRIKDQASSFSLASQLKGLDFGGIKLGQFSNLALQNLSLIEDKDFGYAININPQEGMVSIYENYNRWRSVYPQCRDEKCWQESQLTLEDMPADETLIKIANDFIRGLGIDASIYGQPEVNNSWRAYYEREPNREIAWVPDSVQVVYPLIINGQEVYEESGGAQGLSVNINIRAKKASGLWNLTTNEYQGSDYTATTDKDKVLKVAERGGRYYNFYGGERTEEIEIGTPSVGYVKIYKYDEGSGLSDELLVPALIFPVINASDNMYFYRENIAVPLAQEILDEIDSEQSNWDVPVPRPLIEPMPVDIEVGPVKDIPASPPETTPIEDSVIDSEDSEGN